MKHLKVSGAVRPIYESLGVKRLSSSLRSILHSLVTSSLLGPNILLNNLFSKGKYKLRPAVKKLYQLLPKVSASRVSVASRVVNHKHDEVRPAVSRELYQLHRKTWVYKMSNKWKALTQFYCTSLYTQL